MLWLCPGGDESHERPETFGSDGGLLDAEHRIAGDVPVEIVACVE